MLPLAATFALALAIILWAYHKAPIDGKIRGICIGLKIVGVLLLLLCLIEPMTTTERVKPGGNLLDSRILVAVFEAAQEGLLHDVLGGFSVADKTEHEIV